MYNEVVVVEGKNDKARILAVFPNLNVITTNGSEISNETLEMIKELSKTNKIVLVHVCVDDSHTKSGVAKALIELVIQQNPLAHLIEARCRRDYNLDDFWKQCGFHVTNEKPGRSLAGTHLKIWQRKIQPVLALRNKFGMLPAFCAAISTHPNIKVLSLV